MNPSAANTSDMKVVGPLGRFPKASLLQPTASGYVLLALEIDRRLPFTWELESRVKRASIERLKQAAAYCTENLDALHATVFKKLTTAPGTGKFLKRRPDIAVARFDVVLLIEFPSPAVAREFTRRGDWQTLVDDLIGNAQHSLCIVAQNARRIGVVDHTRPGIFQFNYFFAEKQQQNLAVWEYTAGWFGFETGLDNSTVLLPDPGQPGDYTVINFCRWNSLLDVLPKLMVAPTFRSVVQANFLANKTAAMPILYTLA